MLKKLLATFLVVTLCLMPMAVASASSDDMNGPDPDSTQITSVRSTALQAGSAFDQDALDEINGPVLDQTETKAPISLDSISQASSSFEALKILPLSDLKDLAASSQDGISGSQRAVTTRSGSYALQPNTSYTHYLENGDDANLYYFDIVGDCDITAFLDFSDTSLDFVLAVVLFDSQGNQKIGEVSSTQNRFGGQYIRMTASAGDQALLYVESNDGLCTPSDIYGIGLYTTPLALRDDGELNDRYEYDLDVGSFGGGTINASIDNPYDTDWYILTYSGTYKQAPYLEVTSSFGLFCEVYTLNNSTLTYLGEFESTDGEVMLPTPAGPTTYYMRVDTPAPGSTGSYTVNPTIGRCAITAVKITSPTISTDRGWENYGGSYGTRPAVREWVSGQFTALDQYDDPISGIEIDVSFDATNGGTQGVDTVTTGSNGVGYYSISGLWADYWAIKTYVKPYNYQFDTAKLNIWGTQSFSYDCLYFWGMIWVG